MFGGGFPEPLGDPYIDSQIELNQFLGNLRLISMDYGKQIGQISALTGKQISFAKIQLAGIMLQNKNQIKLAQSAAAMQGLNIDVCVTQYENSAKLINIKDVKKCSNSQEMLNTKVNQAKLKYLQSKGKNTLSTCLLKYPAPTQAEDVNNCVSDAIVVLNDELNVIRDENTNLLNEASASTCIQDTQTALQDSMDDVVNNFENCILNAPPAV